MKPSSLMPLLAAALLACAGSAQAQTSIRLGATHIAPNSSATDAVGPMLPGPPSGVSLDVRNKSTLFFSVAQGLNENMEVELALGYPPTHEVEAKLASTLPANVLALNGQKIAEVRQVAPTLFFNYKFGSADSQWRPFVGLGINYTKFDKRVSTPTGNALNGGPTDIRLSDSWGLAGQVGLSYRINERWSVTGALATARVKTKLTATTGGAARKIDIRFRPAVLTVAASYTF